jgi:hypothetical protein
MSKAANKEPASMNKIEEYLELMYEEGEGKVVGTANVLELTATVENLELLIQNQSLMALLSRLLDTEYKANIEMCYNIIRTFAAFSNFIEMHPLLATYKAGALTMKVLGHETSRVSLRERDLSQLNDEEKRIQTGAIDNGTDRESALKHFKAKKNKMIAKSAKLKKWSEKVMTACYCLLTNLAEDLSVERKMLKRGLLDSLVSHLGTTSSIRLLVTIVTFIWKLSAMRENVDRLHELRVISTLSKMLPATASLNGQTFPADELTNPVIKLLISLSFDPEMRHAMVKEGFVPRLVNILKEHPKHRSLVLRLLYHLSVEDRTKAIFTFTDAIPIVMQMIINFPGDHLGRELAGLAVNLSWHPRVAERMCHFPKKNQGLMELVERMEVKKDPLLMKIIRNLSSWSYDSQMNASPEALANGQYEQKGLWSRFVDPLLRILKQEQAEREHDVMVEVIGTLNNLSVYDLPRTNKEPIPLWSTFVRKYDLVSFISMYLVPEMAQLDVVLEVVIFTGQILTDETVAPMIAVSNIPKALFELWMDKANQDLELKVQILFTFLRLLSHQETREELMYGTRAASEILDHCDDEHPSVKATSCRCLDIILECDRDESGRLGQLGTQICRKRFEAHNREWILENQMPPAQNKHYFGEPAFSPESQSSYDYEGKHGDEEDSNDWSSEQKFSGGHDEGKYGEYKGGW